MPNSYLLERDKSRFAPLFTNYSTQIAYSSELDFKIQPSQLVIIDEADDLLYKRPEDFFAVGGHKGSTKPNCKTNPSIICLTATMGQQSDLWNELLAFQNYSELSYWPATVQIPAGIVRSVDEHACITIRTDQLSQMLTSYNNNRAIIFFSDDDSHHLAQMGLKNLLNVASLDCT